MNSSMSTLLTTNQANPWYCPFGTKILHQSKRQTSLLKEIKNFALTESKSSPWKIPHQLKLEISPSVFQETLPRTWVWRNKRTWVCVCGFLSERVWVWIFRSRKFKWWRWVFGEVKRSNEETINRKQHAKFHSSKMLHYKGWK